MGFLSRFIVFSYSYSMSTVTEIMNRYSQRGLGTCDLTLSLPSKEVDVELSEEIADRLNPIAMRIGEQFRLYGIRAKINLRSLLKTLALRNGHKKVIDQDFKELLELADYMNFDCNIIR
jgi:hypothetical protein